MCLSPPKLPDPIVPPKAPPPPAIKAVNKKSDALAKRKNSKKTGTGALRRPRSAVAIPSTGYGANVNV